MVWFQTSNLEAEIGHFKQGRTEDIELEFSGYSQISFMPTFAVFWVRRVKRDGAWRSVGVPHDPSDDEMIKVIRDRTSRYRLAPDGHIN